MVPQLHGTAADPERAPFSEGGYNPYEPQAFEPRLGALYGSKTQLQNDHPETVARCAAIKTAEYTFIARPGGQSELNDRRRDPGESRNLLDSRAHPHVAEALRLRLMNWYINTTGVPPPDKDPRDMPPYYPTPEHLQDPGARDRILDGPT